MKAEIITIGDELLLGQTVDTNSAWMGTELHNCGIAVHQITSISDDKNHILTALSLALERCELILMTGGLGPTKDDITKDTLCEFFNTKLVLNQDRLDLINTFFEKHNLPLLESNRQQAFLPENCEVIANEVGTAAGMLFEKNGRIVVSMPGVPHEMKKMMTDGVLPRVKDYFHTQELVYRMVYTEGIGESFLVEKILDWENSLDALKISIAYLPERGNVKIRLSASGEVREELYLKIDSKIAELEKLIGENIVSEANFDPFQYVGELLRKRKETLATAESCTGGKLAGSIVNIPGSSDYFLGSVISYHNDVKINQLNVESETIKKNGVVSEQVAREMAKGVLEVINSDWAISTTGVAGPNGGDEINPVGTVWIGIANKGEDTIAERYNFEGTRTEIIGKAKKSAILLLKDRILLKEV